MKSIFILLLTLSMNAFAFKLSPMVVEYNLQGDGNSKMFRIENESKEQVAIKIEAFTREIDSKGKEKRVPTDHFKIYPEQLSLNPSDSRAIRVTYQGPKTLGQEAAYRLVASQLPVKFGNKVKQAGIKFLFQFIASVYVTSDKFVSKLEVDSVKSTSNGLVEVKIANTGKKHRQLKGVNVVLKNKEGKTLALNDSVIKGWEAGNILAGGARAYSVKSSHKFDQVKGAVIEINEK